MKPWRELCLIFVWSFFLNLIWENAHSLLYASYKGGPITEFILLHATLGDALMLTALALPFVYVSWFRERLWLMVAPALVLALAIEKAALPAHRWAYNQYMPIIPYLNVGLTPAIQLAVLGYIAYRLVLGKRKKAS